jgi:antiviral helicase SLH1
MIPNIKVSLQNINALSISVVLNRQNPFADKGGNMYAPRFPKSQTEGWFVILCKTNTDEVIAIKRSNWSAGNNKDRKGGNASMLGARPTTRAVIKLPEEESGGFLDGRTVDVLVASDGYPGILYKIEGVEIPDVPKVVDDGGKKDKGKNEATHGAEASDT